MSNGLIQATSQGIAGTYKDGTIKVVITIEPTDAAEAFAILGAPGAPLVIGQLTPEAAKGALQQQVAAADTDWQAASAAVMEQRGGELAKWAGILCADQYFWAWLTDTYSFFQMMHGAGSMEDKAKLFIYEKCGIQSRRELDHNRQAGLTFREEIMKPFHQWREQQHA